MPNTFLRRIGWVALLFIVIASTSQVGITDDQDDSICGVLRVHPNNPRYFTDDGDQAVLLTGSHTWNNLVDMSPDDPLTPFDYEAYLEWMVEYNHNFFRLWAWELTTWDTSAVREEDAMNHCVAPHPWVREDEKIAIDGKPKFNLDRLNDAYFERLQERVEAAHDKGIYASIMLFEGWGLQFTPDAWANHPFNSENNSNGIDGDSDGNGQGLEIHTLTDPDILLVQKAYVRRVIDTVNGFDNVLYEISNENHPESTEWQYAMIRYIKAYEETKPKQHPVGMTFQYKGGSNADLLASPADWISPNNEDGYREDPPAADGSKVIITDTDHLWGIGGNTAWVWKSFLRGLNPIFMDPYDASVLSQRLDEGTLTSIRANMGYALDLSQRVDLASMKPRADLASSNYCLADEGEAYIVFVPSGEELTLKLPNGEYSMSWLDTGSGQETETTSLSILGGSHSFHAPYISDAIIVLWKEEH
jgi:hypothetical protein